MQLVHFVPNLLKANSSFVRNSAKFKALFDENILNRSSQISVSLMHIHTYRPIYSTVKKGSVIYIFFFLRELILLFSKAALN